MVAKGFMAAAAIIICCATTLQGNDQEAKCSGGDCPAACSDKEKCSAEKTACADGKCDDKEECCEKKQVSLEKCSTEKCTADKCSTEKCGAEKCTFSACAGGACDSLKCALDGNAKSACTAAGTCAKSKCSTETRTASNCAEGQCGAESCPVAACAGQVCDALKCALQSCTTASDDDCCPDAVCATGACGTTQCATLQGSGQDCPAGECSGARCSDEVCDGLKCAVGICLTSSGGQLTFTATKSFAGEPASEKCSTEACAEKTCSTEKCGTEKCTTSTCSTSPCSTSNCTSAKCSTEVCTTGTCSQAKCAAEKCAIETCSEKTCTAGECSTGKCGKTACATTECTAGVGELETKLAQLEQLQRDIVELRRTTGAPEQMIVKVTIVEVNRTKCRNMGFDFTTTSTTGKGDLVSQIQRFPALVEALKRNRLAIVMADPALAVTSGRPAKLRVGRSALTTDSNGNVTEGELGTSVNVMARSIGGNKVRVEISPEFDELVQGRLTAESHSFDAAFETTLGVPFVLAEPRTTVVKSVTRIVDGEQRTKEETEEVQRLTVVTVEGVGAPVERPTINQAAYEKTLVEAVKAPEFVTKVYPVPDLQVWKVRPQGVQFDADLLVAHLKSTIDPQSWRGAVCSSPADAEHASGAIEPFERNGSLVICQTEENHEQIANLLQKMRVDGQEKEAAREERKLLDGGVTPASAEESVEAESKCSKGEWSKSEGKCSESKCTGKQCSKSQVSLESEAADQCPGECQGQCDGKCPETAECPCIGGACTR